MDRSLARCLVTWALGPSARRPWAVLSLVVLSGCYAPLFSHGIPAPQLPDEYRFPARTSGAPINYASLTQAPPADYRLGAGDVLEVVIPDLFRDAVAHPLRVQVMSSGEIHLPRLGAINVGNLNLLEAQNTIIKAYRDKEILVSPNVNVALLQKASINVLVLGAVVTPGVHALPKYENDVGHALAAAGGFNDDADERIEVHRRVRILPSPEPMSSNHGAPVDPLLAAPKGSMADAALKMSAAPRASQDSIQPVTAILPSGCLPFHGKRNRCLPPPPAVGDYGPGVGPYGFYGSAMIQSTIDDSMQMFTIPLRGVTEVPPSDIILQAGDVIVVPSRRHEVFFVVGRLAEQNFVRFTVRERERELGGGFLLPKERDIDVVTAVAMAGYIDPIDSPTTVTVHRTLPDGTPMLIHVDLIKARYDRRETVMVQAGDIIYLNPDGHWWFRHVFDRVVDDLILIPYDALIFNRWILKPITRN